MTHPTSLTLSATAGALLLAVPVAVQLALWLELDDMPGGHLVFGACQLLAWGLLMSVCLRIPALHPDATATRGGRVGRRAALVGCALQMAFASVYLVSTLVTGEPLEATFWFFLPGFVALLVGGIAWGLALRRQRRLAPWAPGPCSLQRSASLPSWQATTSCTRSRCWAATQPASWWASVPIAPRQPPALNGPWLRHVRHEAGPPKRRTPP
jgi:hypothetical protein